jgi:hypothetical protein
MLIVTSPHDATACGPAAFAWFGVFDADIEDDQREEADEMKEADDS